MTYNFKRVERYNHAKPPKFLVRWTLASGTILGLALMMLLIFNNIGIYFDNRLRIVLRCKMKIKIHMAKS